MMGLRLLPVAMTACELCRELARGRHGGLNVVLIVAVDTEPNVCVRNRYYRNDNHEGFTYTELSCI